MSSDPFVARHFRRNYWLGIINGTCFGFIDAIIAPTLVLALFVSQLGGSNLLVGLMPAIYNGGWYFPQFFVAHRVQQAPKKMGVYASTGIVRIACWALIVLVVFLIGPGQPSLLLALFFLFFVGYSFLSGISGNVFMTIVGKTIPGQRRGSYFGYRDLTGTAAGIGAGYLISLALNPANGLAFPYNFGVLFILGLAALTIGVILFVLVLEPEEEVAESATSLGEQLRAAGRLWSGNSLFRRYLLTRTMVALADIATPFYAIFATRQLGASEGIVGLYVGLTTLSAMISNPAWSRISDTRGVRPLMLAAAIGALGLPAVGLIFFAVSPNPLLVTPFGLLFVIYGAARTAGNISFPTYLLEIAPASERALYIGLTNTVLGVATFIPVAGGLLLDLFGFAPLFVLALGIAAAGLFFAAGLFEPQPHHTHSAEAG